MTRPRTTGLGRKKKTYTRIAVDYSHKLQILERLEKGGTVGEVVSAFYPNINNAEKKRKQKQISKWKKQANFIKAVCEEGKGCLENYRRRGDATVLPAQAESDIVLWLSTMRKEGCPVSAKMLELKALEVATDTGIPRESFSASYSWRRRFMRRHKLSVRARTRQGQTTSEDAAAARRKFRGEVRAAIVENNITQVFNADQTAVFFEYLPRKTITTRGEKTVWVKCSGKDKERATAMLLADWHGNKRAPFLVFKAGVSRHQQVHNENESKRHGFGVRLWKEIAPLQAKHDCQIYGNRTAWWNSDISVKFLDYHFGHRDNMHEKILLLWDDFSGHWTEEVTQYAASINVVLLKVPPRYTYVCQPADVAWNQPFKSRLRSRWVECLRSQISEHHAKEKQCMNKEREIAKKIAAVTRTEMQGVAKDKVGQLQDKLPRIAFEMAAPKRHEITAWIADSWSGLSVDTIVSGFAKTELLTDTRSVVANHLDKLEDIDDVLNQLADLGLANETIGSGDELVSSDSSDNDTD